MLPGYLEVSAGMAEAQWTQHQARQGKGAEWGREVGERAIETRGEGSKRKGRWEGGEWWSGGLWTDGAQPRALAAAPAGLGTGKASSEKSCK